MLVAYGLLAAVRDDAPAVLHAARPCQRQEQSSCLLGGTVAGFGWSGGTGCAAVSETRLLD
jgi:hypothetical protein